MVQLCPNLLIFILVPQALEKSGSAKLEKAEILQMTVDYLKTLNPNQFESNRVARDYHGVGFRECASEVSRYLVSVEGMDIQDPLRIRLMSHLQMFIAQRTSSGQVHSQSSQMPPMGPVPSHTNSAQYSNWSGYNPPSYYDGIHQKNEPFFDPFYGPPRPPSTTTNSSGMPPTNYTMTMTATAGVPAPIGFTASVQAAPLISGHLQYHHPNLTPLTPQSESSTPTSTSSPTGSRDYANLSNSKPYRPWGAEMAC